MSLITEAVSTVGESQLTENTEQTLISPQVTLGFPISSGQPKQVVGYCAMGFSQYAPVLDIFTNQPIELPEYYLPTFFFITPIKNCLPTDQIGFGFSESPTVFINKKEVTDWIGSDINTKGLYGFGGTVPSIEYIGKRFLILINYNFPTPTPSVLKVALQYITFA